MILPEKLPVAPMRRPKPVYLSQLEDVEILWPGDVRMLAEFVLRAHDAKDQQTNLHNPGARTRSRTTLHDVADFGYEPISVGIGISFKFLQNHTAIQQRPLHGLALQFAQITWLPKERIETIFLAHGFNLGSVVELD
jgi:hypothetical protein